MTIIFGMIEIKIQEAAKKAGVETGYQLHKVTGFHVTMCYRLWAGDWKQSDLKTLNTLCNVLKCTPNDILEFTPDNEE